MRISDWSSDVCSSDLDYFLVWIAIKGVSQMLAKKVGIAPEAVADTLIAEMGHSGAAHPLVMLSAVLEKARPGERILLASFGQGCDLLLKIGRASCRERVCQYV